MDTAARTGTASIRPVVGDHGEQVCKLTAGPLGVHASL